MSADLLWNFCYCNLADVKAISKRVKKWTNLGLYLEVTELTPSEKNELREAIKEPGQKFGNVQSPEERLLRKSFNVMKGEVYQVCLYGPKITSSCRHSSKIVKLRSEDHDFFVVQQVMASAEPHVSIPLTYDQALRTASGAKGVISYIVQVLEKFDSRTNPRKEAALTLEKLAAVFGHHPDMATPSMLDDMKSALKVLEESIDANTSRLAN